MNRWEKSIGLGLVVTLVMFLIISAYAVVTQ